MCRIVTIVLLIPAIVEKSTGFLTLHSKQDFSNQAYNIHTYILYSIYTHITYTHLPNNPSLYFYWLSKSRPEYINISMNRLEGNRARVPRGLFPLEQGIFAEVIICG